jgi:hypothetical protein
MRRGELHETLGKTGFSAVLVVLAVGSAAHGANAYGAGGTFDTTENGFTSINPKRGLYDSPGDDYLYDSPGDDTFFDVFMEKRIVDDGDAGFVPTGSRVIDNGDPGYRTPEAWLLDLLGW